MGPSGEKKGHGTMPSGVLIRHHGRIENRQQCRFVIHGKRCANVHRRKASLKCVCVCVCVWCVCENVSREGQYLRVFALPDRLACHKDVYAFRAPGQIPQHPRTTTLSFNQPNDQYRQRGRLNGRGEGERRRERHGWYAFFACWT